MTQHIEFTADTINEQHILNVTSNNGDGHRFSLTTGQALELAQAIQDANLITTEDWIAGYRAEVEANQR